MSHLIQIGRPLLVVSLCLGLSGMARGAPPTAAEIEFFEKEVRPLLVDNCQSCHGASKTKGGLKLTSRASILEGGETGPAAVSGKPKESLLIRALNHADRPRMPPKKKLKDREIAVLTRWVEMGLPWPEVQAAQASFHITAEQRAFWSFQPLKAAPPPAVRNATWSKGAIDRFILAGLEAKGLAPAPPADKRTLLRRATFDLTGLPPTAAEIDAFLRDDSPEAFSRVIDRLLASPQYGERWGRHWLDVVRYTDSFDARGIGSEGDISEAWRYRDWVVDAFNRDLPYDRFILKQLAGDLLRDPRTGQIDPADIVATTMLALGNWGGGDADKEKLLTDIVDDQIDVVGRAFLGLTLACARCHDHKFDPIATADYYALAGIFFSTHILPNVGPKTNGPPMLRVSLATSAEIARRDAYLKQVAALEKDVKARTDAAYQSWAKALLPETSHYLMAAWEYRTRPADQAKLTPDEFARRKGLHAYALRQWLAQVGEVTVNRYRLLDRAERNGGGRQGIHGWHGPADCPCVTVNTRTTEAAILTFRLPPRSIAVHPGPKNGVAVSWRSPIAGTVRITGRVRDGDSACGDGIAWAIDQRGAAGVRELAAGDIGNGGAQDFAKSKDAGNLRSIAVKPGDMLELLVLPKSSHICDTTIIDWKIDTLDGKQSWDLSGDVVDDLLQGNPHADRQGHSAVWHFYDMGEGKRGKGEGSIGPALVAWQRVAAEVAAGTADRRTLEEAAQKFQESFEATDARSPFWVREAKDEQTLPEATRAALAKARGELAALKKTPPPPLPFANGAQDGGVPGSPQAGIHDVRIHIRGRYDRLGDKVPRRFPEILAGLKQPSIAQGSGRIDLARWLASPEHPLTARVMVNRIWHHHFGAGIVRTPGNFGKLGDRPTHPELLDYLARQFRAHGWSIKTLHREIMCSAAYRQASIPNPATHKADPDNRLFGWMNRRRLEAEAVRDNLLTVSGKLDRSLGGKGVRDLGSPRRTLYVMTVRSDRSGFGPLFDAADPTAIVDRRTISTVAPQALFLMNNPFALEQARALAARCRAAKGDDGERIDGAYLLLYGRPPSVEERKIGLEFLQRGGPAERAWEEYCAVLLCANEFVYVD